MACATDAGKLEEIYSQGQIAERIAYLAKEIARIYGDEPVVAVCVLKGAFAFFSDLVRAIDNPHLEVDFVRLSSYGMNSESSKHVIFSKDLETDIRNKHVLIVEDIVDSGYSMRFLLDQLLVRQPLSLRIAALVDKRERRSANVLVDFAGFVLESGFLVGYGLDYAERYRALPNICELKFVAAGE